MPLVKIVLKPLAKSVLIPLGLRAGASVTDAATHQKMFGSGCVGLWPSASFGFSKTNNFNNF